MVGTTNNLLEEIFFHASLAWKGLVPTSFAPLLLSLPSYFVWGGFLRVLKSFSFLHVFSFSFIVRPSLFLETSRPSDLPRTTSSLFFRLLLEAFVLTLWFWTTTFKGCLSLITDLYCLWIFLIYIIWGLFGCWELEQKGKKNLT